MFKISVCLCVLASLTGLSTFAADIAPTSISQHEAIARVKAALHTELYVDADPVAPQARDRYGKNGCKVYTFDIDPPYAQYLVTVNSSAKDRDARAFDMMDPDEFGTPVMMQEKDGVLEFSYHRKGIDDDGYKTDEVAGLQISNDGNTVTATDRHGSSTCELSN